MEFPLIWIYFIFLKVDNVINILKSYLRYKFQKQYMKIWSITKVQQAKILSLKVNEIFIKFIIIDKDVKKLCNLINKK